MKHLVVSPEARSDLHEIRAFSRRRWGEAQATEYVGLVLARFAWLMTHSGRGARQDHLMDGLRRVNVRRHAIFYRETEDIVEISRVLHERMDHAVVFQRSRESNS